MASDPPFGIQYDPSWRHEVDPSQRTAVGTVRNDDRAAWGDAFALFPGPVAYVWHAGLMAGVVASELEQAGFALRAQIIWRKQHFAMSRGHYHWQHEPAWYAVRVGETAHWTGSRSQTTVWDVPNLNPHGGERSGENAVTGHGTQKPVALWEIPIRNHTESGDTIYDPFAGSGTAVIAAEKTGRTCVAVDIDPRYVQATITRWEQFTGGRAMAIGGATETPTAEDAR
jgi:DNA modification methylase